MLQETITYIILAISFGLTIYRTLGFFNVFDKTKTTDSLGCSSGSCSSCSFKHLHTAITPILPLNEPKINEFRLRN